jgi:hypothetical protein
MDLARWPAGGGSRRRLDTHISTVVLAGDLAYKIKKPLDLGFLDFLSLASREQACHEELRLNSRLAPAIYQAVCAITGSIERPQIDGDGEVIDWAVRMQRFDADAILSNLISTLDVGLIGALAERIAGFHESIAVCDPAAAYGDIEAVSGPMTQNLEQIRRCAPRTGARLEPLAAWTAAQRVSLTPALSRRKAEGHIRECHGDLHLGNVALINGEAVVFDAIEFNPGLRWIDTINDVAFMTMDLQQRGRSDLACHFLDRYLQASGDYEALELLRFYEVYRALVRAKIAAIRFGQADLGDDERAAVGEELDGYLDFAHRLIQPRRGAIVITRGLSGSGKSHVSACLPQRLPAIRLRSDVERKRILGIAATRDATARGAYAPEVTQQTYARLLTLAEQVAKSGYVALVDATFLKAAQREPFQALAARLGLPFAIIDCVAPIEVLRERIVARARRADNVSDADLSVLEQQRAAVEPLSEAERALVVPVSPDQPLDWQQLCERIGQRCFDRVSQPAGRRSR